MMKKLLFVAAVAAFTMTSCKKDYTCECTVLGITASETQKLKKKDAEAWCDESDTAAKLLDGSCELK